METYFDYGRSSPPVDPMANLPAMLLQPLDDGHKEYELVGDTGRVALIHMDDQRMNDRFQVEWTSGRSITISMRIPTVPARSTWMRTGTRSLAPRSRGCCDLPCTSITASITTGCDAD